MTWQTDPPLTTQFISVQRRRSSSTGSNSGVKEPTGTNSSSSRKSIDIGNIGVFELAQDDDDEGEDDEEDGDDDDEEEKEDEDVVVVEHKDSNEASEIEELFGGDRNTAKDRANIKAAQCGRPLELHAQATAAAARIACRAAESARAAAGAASAAATDAAADAVSRAVLQEAKRAAVAEQHEHAHKLSLRRHQSLHPSARLVEGPTDNTSASTVVVDVEVKSAGKQSDTHETEDDDGNVDKCTERRGSLIQTIVPAAEATMHATVAGWSAYNSTLARVIGRDELAANLADNARCHATTAALRMKSVAEARSRSFSGDAGDEPAEDNSLNVTTARSPVSNASEHDFCSTSPSGESIAAVKEERTLTLMSAAAGLPAAAGAIPLVYFNRNTMPRPGKCTSVDNTHDSSIAGKFEDTDASGAKADGKIDTGSTSSLLTSQPTSESTQAKGAITPTSTAVNPKDICDQDIAATPVRMGRGEWALALGTLRQRLRLSASVSDARLRVFMSALCHDPEVPVRYIEEALGLE
eukprot:g1977.t1